MRQSSPDQVSETPKRLPPGGAGSRAVGGLLALALDAALLATGYALNFWVWLGFIRLGHIPNEYVLLLAWTVAPVVALRLGLLWAGGLYRTLRPHLGYHELTVIGAANTGASVGLVIFNLLTPMIGSLGGFPLDSSGEHILRLPWGIVFNDWMISLIALGGIRFLRHQYDARVMRTGAGVSKPTLIVGTGHAAARVARDLADQTQGRYAPAGFIDPEEKNVGLRIHGLSVLGGIAAIPEAAEKLGATDVVIALDQASPRIVRQVVQLLSERPLNLKIVPDLDSLVSGNVRVSALRPVQIGDLLGRSEVRLNDGARHEGLKGKRVLITGAGGSIGCELTRQALASEAAALALIDLSENNLFELVQDIEDEAQRREVAVHAQVGDVTNEAFIERLFDGQKPDIVFHAAAHKHVHLMEAQPGEAIHNNVRGTLCVTQAAAKHRAERLVYVSTDKAVHPTGVMGQTKRIGEMIVSAIAAEERLPFVSVRFGNVLGSRGSVLPTFQRQIERGGPVTVTDPEATRYFMTVDEAVSLLIEAGTGAAPGSVMILNMGRPVKIDDLARNLIRLSGFEPERDIPISYTGLRPGERLNEALVGKDEAAETGEGKPVWVARETPPDWARLKPALEPLLEAARRHDDEAARHELKRILEAFEADVVRKSGGSTVAGDEIGAAAGKTGDGEV